MTAHAHIDWPALAEPVARIVWGAPSTETKDELRWGTRGSRVLNRAKGTWFDHEANCGGGTLDLVPGGDVGERKQWLRDRRLIEDPQRSNGGSNGGGGCFNIIATYDYTDETGALLFQVCRLVPGYSPSQVSRILCSPDFQETYDLLIREAALDSRSKWLDRITPRG